MMKENFDEAKKLVNPAIKDLDKKLIGAETIPSPTTSMTKDLNEAVEKTSMGLGDTIEKVIKATGADKLIPEEKDCGCEERKENLNRIIPYNANAKDKEWFADYLKRHDSTDFKKEDVFYLVKIYTRTFRKRVKVCTNCSDAINTMNEIVKRLKKELCQEEIKI